MNQKIHACLGCLAMLSTVLAASAASAQAFSPYLEKTGKGAYDQFNDALLCGAVLQKAMEGEKDGKQRKLQALGVKYTAEFSRFMLGEGNVMGPDRKVLRPAILPSAQKKAKTDWQAILATLEGKEAEVAAEITRCLSLYGHEW